MDIEDIPYVSVVVPLHNARVYVMDLICSLINQSYPTQRYEVILVDDASTDGTFDFVRKNIELADNFRLLSLNKKSGPAIARNVGILAAKGEIVAFTDADCSPDKDWLKLLVAGFRGNEIGGVYGDVVTSKKEPIIYPIRVAPVGPWIVTANVAYRRSVLLSIGLFDGRFRECYREDTDLALRVMKAGFKIIHEPNARVYHPVKKLNLLQLVKMAFLHQYDVLLYSKHREKAKEALGTWLTKPFITFLSPSGLVFLMSIILSILLPSVLPVLIVLLLLLVTTFFLIYGYKYVIYSKGAIPYRFRIKLMILNLVYLIVLLVARIWGSIKFRCILL